MRKTSQETLGCEVMASGGSNLPLYPQCPGQSLAPTIAGIPLMFVEWILKLLNSHDFKGHALLQFRSRVGGHTVLIKSAPSRQWATGPVPFGLWP